VQPKLAIGRYGLASLAAIGTSVWAVGAERVGKSENGLIALWGPTP